MNPKDSIGLTKAPLSYLPPAALVPVAQVLRNGAEKYGRANWREHSLLRTVYLEAALRHVFADLDGETIDQESGLPHVAHAVAGLLILLDADALGKCHDDRPMSGEFANLCAKLFRPTKTSTIRAADGLTTWRFTGLPDCSCPICTAARTDSAQSKA